MELIFCPMPPEGGADPFLAVDLDVFNPTNAALVKYGFYALDILHTQTLTATAPNIVFKGISYVTPVTTNNIKSGIIGVVQTAIPSLGRGLLRISGVTVARIEGTSAIGLEKPLKCGNGVNYVVVCGANSRFHATALEAYSTAAVAEKLVLLNGGYGLRTIA